MTPQPNTLQEMKDKLVVELAPGVVFITPKEVLKLHKTPIESRPVDRVFNSQMKTYEQLVAAMITLVLDDIEDERVKQGKKKIMLNSTRL